MTRSGIYFFAVLSCFCFCTGCIRIEQYEFPAPVIPPTELPCNGHPELCSRTFNEVVFPTTHNSFNYEFGPTQFLFPNQNFDVASQLNSGVRGLMLDVYDNSGQLVVYHGFALTGSEPLTSPLGQIRDFLDTHPREIVSIIFETTVDGNTMGGALTNAGLMDYIHAQPIGESWPTLDSMISSGKRLVVFTEDASQGGNPAWFHYAWGYIFDTPYDAASRSDFSCDLNRGTESNSLFLINHWITLPVVGIGNSDSANAVNQKEILLTRARACMAAHSKLPNFLAVDFYLNGDLMEVVDTLNGIGK